MNSFSQTKPLLKLLLAAMALMSVVAARPPVHVDSKGILRDARNREVAFFGVNYTVPFAYGYRAVQYTGDVHEKIIDQDVYHISRMGANAFRVHIWDTEISDTLGNLLHNEHLRLFDYLVARFKERGIKTMITPIAFWGNGYPERDMPTPGFSHKYGKGNATRDDHAIRAQENYLKQFIQHKNPYTGLTYLEDPDIILLEINNEPSHGNREQTASYIQRTVAAVREAGWDKPVLYNVSQNWSMAETFLGADIDGITFQWYPSGLVRNREQPGNFLPHVDKYPIPFASNPAFGTIMKATYEFDAADIMLPFLYPAIARSYREAGFQWTTQFAYDPINTAFANTEYQTHYLNLVYTPAKAVSMKIAAHVYRNSPLGYDWGSYPTDSIFGPYRLSYAEHLSEMNTPDAFYYSGSTQTKPVSSGSLKEIAGVGSSPVVEYPGSGAYFLDKLDNGIWRLEVYPDAVPIRDPFERASLEKEVTRIEWRKHPMALSLPDLGPEFTIKGLNEGNVAELTVSEGSFDILPGAWLLVKKGKERHKFTPDSPLNGIKIGEFHAPRSKHTEQVIRHNAPAEVSEGGPFVIKAYISGVGEGEEASVSLSRLFGGRERQSILMDEKQAGYYEASVPQSILSPGVIQYSISVRRKTQSPSTQGTMQEARRNPGTTGMMAPVTGQSWQTRVVPRSAPLYLYKAEADYPDLEPVTTAPRSSITYTISGESGNLAAILSAGSTDSSHLAGWQLFVGQKLEGRRDAVSGLSDLVVRARTNSPGGTIRVTLINRDGVACETLLELSVRFKDYRISIAQLKPGQMLLLPRPYPGFLPLWFRADSERFDVRTLERIQVLLAPASNQATVEIESIWLSPPQ